jgi:hypothetical protein
VVDELEGHAEQQDPEEAGVAQVVDRDVQHPDHPR